MLNITVSILVNILLFDGTCRQISEVEMLQGQTVYKCRTVPGTDIVEMDLNRGNQTGKVYLRRKGTVLSTMQQTNIEDYTDLTEFAYLGPEYILQILQRVQLDFESIQVSNDLLHPLKNLKQLELFRANSNLSATFLSGLVNLQILRLENARMVTIPDHFLRSQYGLINLTCKNSALETIGDNTFNNMSSLKTLNLRNNQLVDISSRAFTPLKKLSSLNLCSNKLKTLHKDLFNNQISLHYLDLSDNKLTSLPVEIFFNNSALIRLHLQGNQLLNIPSEIFIAQTKLFFLFLNNNKLNTLSSNVFSNQRDMVLLDLHNNELTDLPEGIFRNTSDLGYIDLSNNRLANIPSNIIGGLYRLGQLRLANNRLSALPKNWLPYQPQLQLLDLSNNMLSKLPDAFLLNTRTLKKFNVSNNEISVLPRQLFPPSLELLDLSNNRLRVSPFINAFRKQKSRKGQKAFINIEKAFLRNNSIPSIAESYIRIPRLKTLDLSYNNLTQLSFKYWQNASQVSLNFSHNHITHIACDGCTDYFSNLIMDNNPLACDQQLMELLMEIPLNDTETRVQGTCAEPTQYEGVKTSSFQKLEVPSSEGCPENCTCAQMVLHSKPVNNLQITCAAEGLDGLPDSEQVDKQYAVVRENFLKENIKAGDA